MFNRKKTYVVYKENGSTSTEDLSAASLGFEKEGVHFCIHVICKEKVTITRTIPGQDGKTTKVEEQKEFEQPISLGDDYSETNLLGKDPSSHPDQLYLDKVSASTLLMLKEKTIVRVEIDDTIQLCDTHATRSCSIIVPAWCKDNLGDVPTFIFVHRSDRGSHNTGKKYAYDLRSGREDYHDSWQWDDTAPSTDLAHKPPIKVLPKYVVDFRCAATKCLFKAADKRSTGTVSVTLDKPTKADILNAMNKLPQCPKCKQDTKWEAVTYNNNGKTRLAKLGETGIIP